jgi:hypothetical protein
MLDGHRFDELDARAIVLQQSGKSTGLEVMSCYSNSKSTTNSHHADEARKAIKIQTN